MRVNSTCSRDGAGEAAIYDMAIFGKFIFLTKRDTEILESHHAGSSDSRTGFGIYGTYVSLVVLA